MKQLLSIFLLLFSAQFLFAQEDASYFLPENQNYNTEIPTPEEVIGHPVGKWHVSHDKLSEYMRTLAAASDRIHIENRGVTYED